MNSIQKSLSALAISVAALGACAGGVALIEGAESHHLLPGPEQVATANDLSSVFRDVGKVVEPSVVNITVHKAVKGMNAMPFHAAPFNDENFRRFFKDNPDIERFFPNFQNPGAAPNQENQNNDDADRNLEQVGTGSGVIMEVDGSFGYILTNNHVAGGATQMTVTLADGRRIDDAKLLGADPKSDLAVIRIQADHLIAAKWGDSSAVHQGDWVMAFGSPFGYSGSMTHGIVSALDRNNVGILGSGGYEDFIQVDAPINPGNSGGPLVNLKGEVIGINTAIASRTGAFSGIGFAIPVSEAKFVYGSLKDHGKVVRGWLGVSIADISRDPKVAESFGYKGDKGVLVESALPNSPASGKLEAGDIIESLNGKAVDNIVELRNAIAATAPDTELKMTVWRKNAELPVSVKIGTQPQNIIASNESPGQSQNSDALGMTLSDANDNLARQFNLGDKREGALVTQVKHGSPAEMAGIRRGDLITRIDSASIKNAAEAGDFLSKRDLKTGVRLYIQSPQGSRFVFIEAQ